MACKEIATMIKISQVIDDNKQSKLGQEMNYDIIPRIYDYGQMKLEEFNQ